MILKLLIVLTFGTMINSNAQNLTIKHSYIFDKSNYKKDSMSFNLNMRLYPTSDNIVKTHPIKKVEHFKSNHITTTVTTYELQDTSLSIIGDGYGHEIILIPNDTIIVTSTIEDSKKFGDSHRVWRYKLNFSGKNKHIHSLFDSLAYKTGDVKISRIQIKEKTLPEFLEAVDQEYQVRESYVNSYCKTYNISNEIKSLVMAEVYSAYVKNIISLQSSQAKVKNPIDYTEILNERIDFNKIKSEPFLKTVSAPQILYEYFLMIGSAFSSKDFFSEERFNSVYKLIKGNIKYPLRNEMLTSHFLRFIKLNYKPYLNTLSINYATDCSNSKLISHVNSLLNKKKNLPNISYKDILTCKVMNMQGDSISLKNIFKGKMTLIDCWASWCKPCLAEFQYSIDLQKKLSDQISLLYLSFDQNEKQWKSKAKELNIENASYLLPSDFDSSFALYFEIASIPRYILLDSAGNIISKDTPRPNDPKLRQLIYSILNKDKNL